MTKAGNSKEQQVAEAWMLKRLSSELDLPAPLTNKRIDLKNGGRIEVDGFHPKPLVLCEAWAHIGPPKSAQRDKVMTDALRLFVAAKEFPENCRRILLFGDHEAAKPFRVGRSWTIYCLSLFDIEIVVTPLPAGLRELVERAQMRQYR